MMSILMLVVLVFQGSVGAFQGRLAICLGDVDASPAESLESASTSASACTSGCCGHSHDPHNMPGIDQAMHDDDGDAACAHDRGISLLFSIHAEDGQGCNCSDVVIVLKGDDASVRGSELELIADSVPWCIFDVACQSVGQDSMRPIGLTLCGRDDDPGRSSQCARMRTTQLLI